MLGRVAGRFSNSGLEWLEYVMPKFTCRSCGMSLKSIKSYVDHQMLHRHEANSSYPYFFSDCKQKFTKSTALKDYVYRSQNSSVSQLDDTQRPFVCDDVNCKKQCIDPTDLLAYLKVHLSKHE